MSKAVVLDFGGVFAEEGFREGLHVIARRNGLCEKRLFEIATMAVYDTGYITGSGTENDFWEVVCEQSHLNIKAKNDFRREILGRFIPRPWMLNAVRIFRLQGYIVAILSDQSDWLDLLNDKHNFFHEFDAVFNSYHLGKTKRDPTIFDDALRTLNVKPEDTLFVDDNAEHINRAVTKGLKTHLFISRQPFKRQLHSMALLFERFC